MRIINGEYSSIVKYIGVNYGMSQKLNINIGLNFLCIGFMCVFKGKSSIKRQLTCTFI